MHIYKLWTTPKYDFYFLNWKNNVMEHLKTKTKKTYSFMAMMYRKWGANSLNIGCEGERHLLAATQIPSISKWVYPLLDQNFDI